MPAAVRAEAPERYSAADFEDSDSEVESKTTLQDYVKSKAAPLMPKKTQRQVDTTGFEGLTQLPSKRAAAFIQQELEAANAKAAAVARAARASGTTTPPPANATTTPTPASTAVAPTTATKSAPQQTSPTPSAPTPTPTPGAAPHNAACGRGKSTRKHRKPLDNYLEGEDGDWVVLPKDGLPAAAAVWVR